MDDSDLPSSTINSIKRRPQVKNWIAAATSKMKSKGTIGKFGKATPTKIESAMKQGGVRKKEAVFAENLKNIAQKNAPRKKDY